MTIGPDSANIPPAPGLLVCDDAYWVVWAVDMTNFASVPSGLILNHVGKVVQLWQQQAGSTTISQLVEPTPPKTTITLLDGIQVASNAFVQYGLMRILMERNDSLQTQVGANVPIMMFRCTELEEALSLMR